MECLYCSGETHVVNSRHRKRTNDIWRRRKCLACGGMFTTEERASLQGSIMIRHGKQLSPFNRDRLFLSIYESCRHRSSAIIDAGALTQIILSDASKVTQFGTISRDELVRTALRVIRRLDRAAATSYAAYHPIKG